MSDLDDLRLVSLFAAALGGLSDAHLDALDAAALDAERARRRLRVGRGFGAQCEAA